MNWFLYDNGFSHERVNGDMILWGYALTMLKGIKS